MSVIVPVLDDAEALATLLPQLCGAPGIEVLVVDGGSRDASLRIAAQADRVLQAPPGRSSQLAAGTAAAHGLLLWMVHADSSLPVGLIDSLRAAACDPTVRWGRVDVRLAHADWRFRLIEAAMNLRSRLTGICTGDQGIFVRREVLEAIGGVPTQPLMEDIELSKRLRRLGAPRRVRGPIETSPRRWLRDGVARTVARMWGYRLAYFLGAEPAHLAERYYRPADEP